MGRKDGRQAGSESDPSPRRRAGVLSLGAVLVVAATFGLLANEGSLPLSARFRGGPTDDGVRERRSVTRMEADGYRRAVAGEARAIGAPSDDRAEILFVGHIYPRSDPARTDAPTTTLARLDRFVVDRAPDRVVLGGDNVRTPSIEELRRFDRLIAGWPSRVRPILGNHERYREMRGDSLFERLFEPRFGFVDHDGVRLVWLHTDLGGGDYGLDEDQTSFIHSVLSGEHRYALVFLHHALWAGETSLANEAYLGAAGLARAWSDSIVPVLRQGRVRGVFSGDGGVNRRGGVSTIEGMPHFVTGWPPVAAEHLPEWLLIRLLSDGIEVTSFLVAGDVQLQKVVWPEESESGR